MELGQVLKEIRLNRGHSQLNVAHKIISQGVYSKVEAGTRELDAVGFLKIANRLNVTPDEIEFISNGYNYNEKQQILNEFFQLNYNDPERLKKIKAKAMDYLKHGDDLELREIHLLCDALLVVSDSEDFDRARELIEPIWRRLKKYDQWYLYDIRLINTILFMYPLDTTIAFSQRVLERLKDYEKHEKVDQLKDIYNINLSLLLIKAERYEEALEVVEERLENRKRMNYTMLALHLGRRALCKKLLHIPGHEEDQVLMRYVLEAYEAHDLLKRLEEEFEQYTIEGTQV